jgi:DNA-binding transcriptional ArsR family regulator
MLGFPIPYPNELLYSTVARAGVHDGETSPKQLLDQVFRNRKVIATIDLPSHVEVLAKQYPRALNLGAKKLISNHTLWPIYAPFQPRDRGEKMKRFMLGSSQGAAHLSSGIAASRVKTKVCLYVCPECLNVQKQEYGECFWNRLWQVPLIKACPEHGPLHATNIELNGEHRHSYIHVESAIILNALNVATHDMIFARQVAQLLGAQEANTSFAQWSFFYKQFAIGIGFKSGANIDHSRIHDAIIRFWGSRWLEDAGLLPATTETSWLKTLFRKHRKSFSFAEHIVAITALSGGGISIVDAIEKTSRIKNNATVPNIHIAQKKEGISEQQLSSDQILWRTLLNDYPPKAARQRDKALYARLYRNNYDWLMKTDKSFRAETVVINNRVDWPKRDREIARELKCVCEVLAEDLNAPHLSRTFLIHQLNQRATVEKNLRRLPRIALLLSLYSESTTEYQLRRLTRAYLETLNRQQEIKRWSLLRQAGLSDERMTELVAEILRGILND